MCASLEQVDKVRQVEIGAEIVERSFVGGVRGANIRENASIWVLALVLV